MIAVGRHYPPGDNVSYAALNRRYYSLRSQRLRGRSARDPSTGGRPSNSKTHSLFGTVTYTSIGMAGFEPALTRFQSGDVNQTTPHPVAPSQAVRLNEGMNTTIGMARFERATTRLPDEDSKPD